MEISEVVLFCVLFTHYFGTVLFISWLFVAGTPTEISNYGLPN